MYSCTKTEYIYVPQEGEDNTTDTKSIVGMWEWQSDSLVFMSFDQWGCYSYCLGKNLMAYGNYSFDGTKLHLTNLMHGGKQEEITVTFANSSATKIDKIEGNLYIWGANSTSYNRNIYLTEFTKVNRTGHISLAGTEYDLDISQPYRINGVWYDGIKSMQYTTACEARNVLKIKKNGVWVEHSSKNHKYIYRPNTVYRQSYTTGQGQIEIHSLWFNDNGSVYGEGPHPYSGYRLSDNAIWW